MVFFHNFFFFLFPFSFAEGDWKVIVVTEDLENGGTTATVSLYVYGEATCSGPFILGSGKYQLFNTADIFKVNRYVITCSLRYITIYLL